MNYFEDSSSKHFSFESSATGLHEDSFAVIQFKGYEAISTLYDFEIFLVSSNLDLDLDDVLRSPAVFTIHRGEKDDVPYHGMLAEFEQMNEFNGFAYYKARLVPKLWRLTQSTHNQVFLKDTVPEIVSKTLQDGGLETADFDLSGMQYDYEPMEYVCQYRESHYNFILRWLEREGAYYSFLQDPDGEKLIFSDTNFSTEPLSPDPNLYYSPPTGLESAHLAEVIRSLTCRQIRLPGAVTLKDHNYELATPDIIGTATVEPGGFGNSYIYGEHFTTTEEGERLALIRAQEMLGRKKVFYGESTVPYMSPGYSFHLNQHYRDTFNAEYLITEVIHEGFQSSLLSSGIASGMGVKDVKNSYINTFKAIPADTQYRPEHKTERPRISGTLQAKIDGELDSEYAQLDEHGRYKIRVPFDVNSDLPDGMASAWVRMVQPYAGTNRGMQFPLRKGTEVLLTFIDGNPDRPMIAGAVNTAAAPGPVTVNNQSESVIQTGGSNRIRMEDKHGSQRMVLESPTANSWLRIGAHNDPIVLIGPGTDYYDPSNDPNGNGFQDQGAKVTILKADNTVDHTETIFATTISLQETDDGSSTTSTYTDASGNVAPIDNDYVSANPGIYIYQYSHTNTHTNITYTANRMVISGNDEEVKYDSHGIRLITAGSYWQEASSRVGRFIGDKPPIADTMPKNENGAAEAIPPQSEDVYYGMARPHLTAFYDMAEFKCPFASQADFDEYKYFVQGEYPDATVGSAPICTWNPYPESKLEELTKGAEEDKRTIENDLYINLDDRDTNNPTDYPYIDDWVNNYSPDPYTAITEFEQPLPSQIRFPNDASINAWVDAKYGIPAKTSQGAANSINQIGNLLGNFGPPDSERTTPAGYVGAYNPKGLINRYPDASGNYVAYADMADAMQKAQVNVSSMDVFTTHEGNVYDFGGYWSYNLGNGYEENHMAQGDDVELNRDAQTNPTQPEPFYDLLNKGGPNFTSINWPSASNLGPTDAKLGDDWKYFNEDGSTNLWVTKSFGHSYEYTEGDSISVSSGSKLSIEHIADDDRDIEIKYSSDGTVIFWGFEGADSAGIWTEHEKTWDSLGNPLTDEKTTYIGSTVVKVEMEYDRVSHNLVSIENSTSTGGSVSSSAWSAKTSSSAEIYSNAIAEASIYASAKAEASLYASATAEASLYAAASEDFSIFVGISSENSIYTGKFETENFSDWSFKSVFCEAKGTEATEMHEKMNTIQETLNTLNDNQVKLSNGVTDIETIDAVKLTG